MRIRLVDEAEGKLDRKVWWFYLDVPAGGMGDAELMLDQYIAECRPTQRHKYHVREKWERLSPGHHSKRGQICLSEVPQVDVEAVRKQLLRRIYVKRWWVNDQA